MKGGDIQEKDSLEQQRQVAKQANFNHSHQGGKK
jgi:hypothetical protein